MANRYLAWLAKQVPTRDTFENQRFLRPLAPHLGHPSLWSLNRRSVPRGVALGLFIAVIIPVLHTAVAAVLAIPTRANVAVAALFTLVVNPLTIPPLYYAAYRLGWWELHHDAPLVNHVAAERFSSEPSRMLFWVHEASGSIAVGVLTIAVASAVIGYLAAAIGWRLWSRSRWVKRRAARN